jgi:TonB family protein
VSLRRTGVLLAVMAMAMGAGTAMLRGQEADSEMMHRARTKVQPDYPALARKMKIGGTVRVRVVVAANGTVKEAKVMGGHPVLADAALNAAKKWRFEPAATETTGVVEFKFEPHP